MEAPANGHPIEGTSPPKITAVGGLVVDDDYIAREHETNERIFRVGRAKQRKWCARLPEKERDIFEAMWLGESIDDAERLTPGQRARGHLLMGDFIRHSCAQHESEQREAARRRTRPTMPRIRVRAPRRAATRAGAPAPRRTRGSARASGDSGEDGPAGSRPRLALAPKPAAIYTYGVVAREKWGLD